MLSAQFPSESNITVEGEITYNGVPQKEIVKRVPQFVEYVPQSDKHFATLTTRETIEYAHKFVGADLAEKGAETLTQGSTKGSLAAIEAAKTCLKNYLGVVIGYGERKRVMKGEMAFGIKCVSLMDKISAGLDSAAKYDITSTQCSIAKTAQGGDDPLLLPVPDVFDLNSIMNEGEMMYHGRREDVIQHFERLGFKCPIDRDITGYLLDLGPLPMGLTKHPRSASESSIHPPPEPEPQKHMREYMNTVKQFCRSWLQNVGALSVRHMIFLWRNKACVTSHVVMACFTGLIYCSAFYNVDPMDVQVMLGVIFQAVFFMSLSQASQFLCSWRPMRSSTSSMARTSTRRCPHWCGFVANVVAFVIYLVLLTRRIWFCRPQERNPQLPGVDLLDQPHRLVHMSAVRERVPFVQYGGVNYCSEFNMKMGEYYLAQFGVSSSKTWLWTVAIFLLFFYVLLLATSTYLLEYRRYLAPTFQLIAKGLRTKLTKTTRWR
ncbi:ABC transporter G family member 45 [Phytophthora citrophthora]|uniref:ABC transporter G family member 45 n=1 Tax=Phytophthora citrophthora TaxID=4793 RepID=A0AAD9LAK0_9STRA|nr:ABC transporter G family member 45 [Phytophthora citrophthora]